MNTSRLYLIIGAVLIAAVVIFILLPDESDPPHAEHTHLPPGHPDFDQMQQMDGNVQPDRSNVRSEFMQEYMRLREKVESQPADDTSDVLIYARMLLDAHQAEASVKYFERYHEATPDNISVMLDLSVAYFDSRQTEKAEAVTKLLLSKDPGNTTGMYNLGAIFVATDREQEAKKVWGELVSKYPDSPDAKRAKEVLATL